MSGAAKAPHCEARETGRAVSPRDDRPDSLVNLTANPYRSLSVQESPVALRPEAIRAFLMGRNVYRRTRFMVLHRQGAHALVRVHHAGEALLESVTAVEVLGIPDDTVFLRAPEVDTASATQMAQTALESGQRARVFIVEGCFAHVNFIVEPRFVPLRLIEVVPPHPPKLEAMARQVLAVDAQLPPVALDVELIDLNQLATLAPDAAPVMFPCRCSGVQRSGSVSFLDAGPDGPPNWWLVGCERSVQLHRALYGESPSAQVDFCPRRQVGTKPALLRCCLLERGVERTSDSVVVPWGFTFDELRAGIRLLVEPR